MAVDIKLYNYLGESNRLSKNITRQLSDDEIRNGVVNGSAKISDTISGYFKGGVDMINPTVEFYDSNDIAPEINDYNYMTIQYENGDTRYYFINDIFIDRTHVFVVSGHVDVLMTYKDDIDKLEAMAIRSEDNYNTYINDSAQVSYQYDTADTLVWDGGRDETGATTPAKFSYDTNWHMLITKG